MAELTPYQRDILIRTALGEARGEGVEGMADVIQNIMNRAGSGRYPSDPAAVALQPQQYSTWNTGAGGNNPQQFSSNSAIYKQAGQALDAVLAGRPDPTGGALQYHAQGITPYWADEANTNGTIVRNGHVYYPTHPVPPGEIPSVASMLSVRQPVTPASITPTGAAVRQMTSPTGGNTALQSALDRVATARRNRVEPADAFQRITARNKPAPQPSTFAAADRMAPLAKQAPTPASVEDRVTARNKAPVIPPTYAGQEASPRPRSLFSGDPGTPAPGQVVATLPTAQTNRLPPIAPSTLGQRGQTYAGQDRPLPAPKPNVVAGFAGGANAPFSPPQSYAGMDRAPRPQQVPGPTAAIKGQERLAANAPGVGGINTAILPYPAAPIMRPPTQVAYNPYPLPASARPTGVGTQLSVQPTPPLPIPSGRVAPIPFMRPNFGQGGPVLAQPRVQGLAPVPVMRPGGTQFMTGRQMQAANVPPGAAQNIGVKQFRGMGLSPADAYAAANLSSQVAARANATKGGHQSTNDWFNEVTGR